MNVLSHTGLALSVSASLASAGYQTPTCVAEGLDLQKAGKVTFLSAQISDRVSQIMSSVGDNIDVTYTPSPSLSLSKKGGKFEIRLMPPESTSDEASLSLNRAGVIEKFTLRGLSTGKDLRNIPIGPFGDSQIRALRLAHFILSCIDEVIYRGDGEVGLDKRAHLN